MASSTRILLVEDNPGDVRLVEELLADAAAPYIVETVSRLADAGERLTSGGPLVDAVLLDLGLPDSQGLDTVRELFAAAPNVATVVLTGLDDDALGFEAIKAGAQDFLPKGRISADSLSRVIGYARERMRLYNMLGESEERFAHLFERAPLGYQSLDAEGRFLEVNEAWLDTLGYDREEVIGKWFGDFLVPGHAKAFRERFERFKAAGTTHSEFRMVAKSGELRYIALDGRVGHKNDGSFDKTHCILKDVTEVKRAEDALRRSEAMRDVAEAVAGVGNWTWVPATQASLWSPGMFRLWDVDPHEFEGGVIAAEQLRKILEERVHPDDLPSVLQATARAAATGEPLAVEFRLALRDGSERIVASEATAEHDADGTTVAITGYYQDVTERRRAEADLRMRSQIIDSAVDSVFIQDLDGTLLFANDSAATSRGYTRDEMVGMSLSRLNAPEFAALIPERIRAIVESGHDMIRSVHLRKDGSRMPVEIHRQTIDYKGEAAVLGVVRDITEREAAEQSLRESEAKFAAAFKSSPDAVNITRLADGLFVEVNQGFTDLTGYTRDDVDGKTTAEISIWVNPADRERLAAGVEAGEVVRDLEAEFRRKDDSVTVGQMSARMIEIKGEPCILSVTRDISEHKRTEAALRETEALRRSEELYREMFDGHTAAMFLADPGTGALERANLAAAELFGIPVERLTEMNIADFSGSPADRLTAELEEAASGGGAFVDVVRLANGSLRNIEVRRAPITLGTRTLLYAIVFDVTERTQAERALRESERQLAEAQRIARLGSWTWDAEADATTYSEEAARIFGHTTAEMDAGPDVWLQYVHPDDRAEADRVTEACESDGRPYSMEYRVSWPDGSEHVLRERGESQLDDEGRVLTMFGTVQDITEQRLAEDELRRRAARLESLNRTLADRERDLAETQRVAHVGGWTWDVAADTLNDSEEALRIYGCAPADMGTDPDKWLDFVHPVDRERAREVTRRAEAEHGSYVLDYRVTWPDGSEHVIRDSGESILDDEGRLVAMSGYVQDITEQSGAERALQESERQLAEAQRIAHIGSWSWDAASVTTTRSEEDCRILGRSPAELGTDPDIWLDCVHPDDRERASAAAVRAEAEGREYTVDFRVVWPDGSERVVRERGEPAFDANGRLIRMWGYTQDITEQRRIEDELKRRAAELELFNRSMVDREMRVIEMKERVNELSRRLGEEPPFAEIWREASDGEGAAT